MKKNEIYEVTCTDLTDMAAGVCRIKEQVVFVYNLLPGEKAKIKIIKVNKNFAIGIVIERLSDAQIRQVPVCPYAKLCGGCQLQHVKYADQLSLKTKWMQNLFTPIPVKKCLGNTNPLLYRNKAQFPVQIKDGKVITGFYRKHSHDVVDMKRCMIQSEDINEIYDWIKKHLTIKNAKGLRHIFIRSSYQTKEAQVVFIGNTNQLQTLPKDLANFFPQIKSIVFNYNVRKDNVILGDDYDVLYGRDYIVEKCMGNEVRLNFKSFFQVNPVMMEVLYQCGIDAAQLSGKESCLDLYAGTGTIGMAISKSAKKVIGVEIIPEAVENAKENVRRNQLMNCEYICQDATIFTNQYQEQIDVVFVDPPRKGMNSQGIEDIVRLMPQKIIYISCNPKTLKRDLLLFKEMGYDCKDIQPVDMFAYTTGVECVATIYKRTNS